MYFFLLNFFFYYKSLKLSTTNKAIVNTVYNNVLGRSVEQAGLDYWVGELESGNRDLANIRSYFLNTTYNVEAAARFGGSTSDEQITDIYMQHFLIEHQTKQV